MLRLAIRGRFTEIVRIFVVDGDANADALDSDGNPPLYGAILGHSIGIIKILVNDGDANVNARTVDGDPLPDCG